MIDNVTQAAIESTGNNTMWLSIIIGILFFIFIGYSLYQILMAD